ncbi:MAG TPA: hypothetical protein VGP83_07135 [Pyrinomonadaceae bacterium]|jgi:hypothetical protein|nr:hypothetical protein [Pyrinomonadaceae bacterium]
MPDNAKLQLELRDVYGKFLGEKVDIILRHQVLSEVRKASPNVTAKVEITGLQGAPQGRYQMEIDPPSYQYISEFVNMKASGITSRSITFPIDPGKVVKVNFQAFAKLTLDLRTLLDKSDTVLSFEGKKGKDLYDALDDIRKAGMLNIATKTNATALSNGRTVLSYIEQLNEVRGDRFFCDVPKELRSETKNSAAEGLFRKVSGSLHTPPPGFQPAESFKTSEKYGNLQLTFFSNGEKFKADIDIDDAGGLEHVFQVLRNKLSGKPTHPYNIHEVLVAHQHLDPGYTFVV